MSTYHTPVLLDEVITGLNIQAGEQYIDATLGGGGHTSEIIKRGGIVLGIDADIDAIAFSQNILKSETCVLVQDNFRNIEAVAKNHGFVGVSGVLMDLGVSSFQLDTASKGFSYRFTDATIDMRFDPSQGMSASEYLHTAQEEELYEVFTKFGEEERAWPIVHALIRARQIKHLETAGDVVSCIRRVVGESKAGNSTLSRIFQALRIQTNDEFASLSAGLDGAFNILRPGGRLAVISFHSLEDRIVKQHLRHPGWVQVTKKPIIASETENSKNRRSRSAKLRIVEKK